MAAATRVVEVVMAAVDTAAGASVANQPMTSPHASTDAFARPFLIAVPS